MDKVRILLTNLFGSRNNKSWSYPLFIMTMMLSFLVAFLCLYNNLPSTPIPSTSLIGYSLIMILVTSLSLLFPTFALSKDINSLIGKYTGAGILITSFISGVPLAFISSALHNSISYLWVLVGLKPQFPAFFYYGGTDTTIGLATYIIADSILPAIGIATFFFGLIWNRIENTRPIIRSLLISFLLGLWSLDPIGLPSIIVLGIWLTFLRDKTKNIFSCILGYASYKISLLLLKDALQTVDISLVQTPSDMDATYFYTSLPAMVIGIILLLFFVRIVNQFSLSYNKDFIVTSNDTKKEESNYPKQNFLSYLSYLIMIFLWVILIKGGHL